MLVTDPSQLVQIREEITHSSVLGIDTETNFTDVYQERYLLGLAIRTVEQSWYIPVGHQPYLGTQPNNIVLPDDLFHGFNGEIVAHNMKFDYQVLTRHGLIIPTDNLWCTMMLSVYVDENHQPGHDLDTVLTRYGFPHKKTVEAAALKKFGWVTAPTNYMAQYAEPDVNELPELYTVLKGLLKENHIKLWENYDRPFMLLLSDIEMRGIPIDRTLCQRLDQQCEERLREIRDELGFDPAKPSQLHRKLFAAPPEGIGLTPSSFTPTGKPQVSLDYLEGVGHPVTALVYEYRKTSKQKSSYFSAYLNLTTREYPVLHPNFKQHGTETGRLSCENPNLQQIPREEYKDASVKRLFLPEKGMQLWEIDYRTIEYRLAAVYAQSEKLMTLFENEGDFHQLVADDITAKVGFKIDRQKAKTINYLMGYGGGVGVLQKQLKVKYSIADEIHKAYKASYPEIFDKAEEAMIVAEADMQIDMWSGRTRHFLYRGETHKAFNAVVQGGAFEILKRSMLRLETEGFTIMNTVHDAVWLSVHNEGEVIAAQAVMEGWTHDVFGLTFRTDRKLLHA